MKEITVNIEGTEYTIDIEKAKSLGLLKDTKIDAIRTGDLFKLTNNNIVLIVAKCWGRAYAGQRWGLAGLADTLELYSAFNKEGATEEEMLQWLNQQKGIKFIKNINDDVKALISSLR